MQIRAAREDEWPICGDIYVRSGRAAFTWVDPDQFRASEIVAWAGEGEELYLAFDGGRPLGMLSFWRPDNFIHNLFVEPWAQGRGVGTALLEFAYGLTGAPVTLKADLRNTSTIRFYQRRGFTEVRRDVGPEGRPYILFRGPERPE